MKGKYVHDEYNRLFAQDEDNYVDGFTQWTNVSYLFGTDAERDTLPASQGSATQLETLSDNEHTNNNFVS